jgi:hypothetical protein
MVENCNVPRVGPEPFIFLSGRSILRQPAVKGHNIAELQPVTDFFSYRTKKAILLAKD